jgi:transposase
VLRSARRLPRQDGQPQDLRAGADRLLTVVVNTLSEARAHHGYLFAIARASRLKLLVHDGFGVWWATWRLHTGRIVCHTPEAGSAAPALQLSTQQFEALALGLPWQRLGELATTNLLFSHTHPPGVAMF